jgi:hypothetical protein
MEGELFSVAERERIQERVLQMARDDPRVTAGAVVGSLALGGGDRWSDLDLTFGLVEGCSLAGMLDEWGKVLADEFGAIFLFDLPAGPSIYRVFLMPGCLQCDLSFTPASSFGATGPKFQLLFGEAVKKPFRPVPAAHELFGYAVHHALRARFCLERGRLWQAEYWISSLRDVALSLACRARGLPLSEGRGYDQLPEEVQEAFKPALVKSLEAGELRRALGSAIEGLLRESSEVRDLAAQVEPQLQELMEEEWEE